MSEPDPSGGETVAREQRELTVGDVRAQMEGLPDDAPMFVTVFGGWDLPITWALGGTPVLLYPGTDRDDSAPGLELHAYPQWTNEEQEAVRRTIDNDLLRETGLAFAYALRKRLMAVRSAQPPERG